MERLAIFFILISFGSCSIINRQQCREMQNKGLVQGTLDSCEQCVEQLGASNSDAVNGCSLGMDAANLIQLGR